MNRCANIISAIKTIPILGQSRLSKVTMIGQEDTDERNVTLPVATYSLRPVQGFRRQAQLSSQPKASLCPRISPRSDDNMPGISSTLNTGGDLTHTLKGLFDFNGDGRPDLVYGHVQQQQGRFYGHWRSPGAQYGQRVRHATFADAGFLNPAPTPPPGQLPNRFPLSAGRAATSLTPAWTLTASPTSAIRHGPR